MAPGAATAAAAAGTAGESDAAGTEHRLAALDALRLRLGFPPLSLAAGGTAESERLARSAVEQAHSPLSDPETATDLLQRASSDPRFDLDGAGCPHPGLAAALPSFHISCRLAHVLTTRHRLEADTTMPTLGQTDDREDPRRADTRDARETAGPSATRREPSTTPAEMEGTVTTATAMATAGKQAQPQTQQTETQQQTAPSLMTDASHSPHSLHSSHSPAPEALPRPSPPSAQSQSEPLLRPWVGVRVFDPARVETQCRFLAARGWQAARAESMLRQCIKWRAELGVDAML